MILFNGIISEGGPCGGGPGGGPGGGTGGGPGGPGPGGCPGGHGGGGGFFGPGCFHVPVPVFPAYYYGYSNPYRKTKKGKKRKYKNPYAANVVYVNEDECEAGYYGGVAKQMFDRIASGVDPICIGSLYPNNKFNLVWKIDEDGKATVYKPAGNGLNWCICEMELGEDGEFKLGKTYGGYKSEKQAIEDMNKEADRHARMLEEARPDPRELTKWIAQGKDPMQFRGGNGHSSVNTRYIQQELMHRFPNQFESVELSDKKAAGGEWTLEFKLSIPNDRMLIRGFEQVRTVIPQLMQINSFLHARGINVNSYNITAKNV